MKILNQTFDDNEQFNRCLETIQALKKDIEHQVHIIGDDINVLSGYSSMQNSLFLRALNLIQLGSLELLSTLDNYVLFLHDSSSRLDCNRIYGGLKAELHRPLELISGALEVIKTFDTHEKYEEIEVLIFEEIIDKLDGSLSLLKKKIFMDL